MVRRIHSHLSRSRRRRAQSGQFIVIYIMSFFTMMMMAYATLSVGQVVVRKQWAQMVADSAAWAGASKQAEGMNAISLITNWEWNLLTAIQVRDGAPGIGGYWFSDFVECDAAYFTAYVSTIRDLHQGLQDGVASFDTADKAVTVVNQTYNLFAYNEAKKVADQNFSNLFPGESGLKQPSTAGYLPGVAPLVKMTSDRFKRTVAWYYWTTDATCFDPWTAWLCIPCFASPAVADITGTFGVRPPNSSFEFTTFRIMDPTQETTFIYWVQIPATKPILGMSLLGNVPPIVAIARAKPYGGHIADTIPDPGDFSGLFPEIWSMKWPMDNEPAQTYKVKFARLAPGPRGGIGMDSIVLGDLLATGWSPRAAYEGLPLYIQH